MFGAGDELAVQLFLLSLAVAVALYGMTLAGWNHRLLVFSTFFFAMFLVVIAVGLPVLRKVLPSFADFRVSAVYWFALVNVLAICLCAREAHARRRLLVYIEGLQNSRPEKQINFRPNQSAVELVKDSFIYSDRMTANFNAEHAGQGSRLRIYLEHSSYVEAIGFVGWSRKTRVLLTDLGEHVKGERISIPLVSRIAKDNRELDVLFWGSTLNEGRSNLVSADKTAGRLVLIGDQIEEEQYHPFFMVKTYHHDKSVLLRFLDTNDLDLFSKWDCN